MAIVFDKTNRIITEGTEISVTIQTLLNAIRDFEDAQVNLCVPQIASAAGKQVLSATALVGVTLTLLNWKLSFGERGSPVVCSVVDGNLVAVDEYGNPMNPIEPSTNVTVQIAQSSSATMVQSTVIDAILERIGVPTSTISSDCDAIQTKIDNLHPDLSQAHGSGSWEGAIEFVEE